MDWQLILVIIVVALAAAYLARSTWRTWAGSKGRCGGGCGCSGKAADSDKKNGTVTLIPPEQLTLRNQGQERMSQ